MSHAETVLVELDSRLQAPIELTIYGKAALELGFSETPEDYAFSMDVDGVLVSGQAEQWARETNFWQAVDDTNQALAPQGLYISHLFEETQVILTPEWARQRMTIPGPWRQLRLFRLGDGDLFLSKLMRYDPLDLADARFIVEKARFGPGDIRAWIERARVPDIPEIREQFALCSKEFL